MRIAEWHEPFELNAAKAKPPFAAEAPRRHGVDPRPSDGSNSAQVHAAGHPSQRKAIAIRT